MTDAARAPRDRPWIMTAMIVLSALLSVALSGHRSGANNNIFHMPILLGLYDEPQFAGDAFIQSLRYYASGFWLLFRGAARDGTLLSFFLPLQIGSRLLFFVGLAALARPIGLAGWRQHSLFLLLVTIAATMRGASQAGNGGLFVDSFTHSELANGTLLLAIALAARQRFGWALFAAGVTFFINVFMAVWLAPPMALLMLRALRHRTLRMQDLVRQLAVGAVACIPLSWPVLANLRANPTLGRVPHFDYRNFLIAYWPDHFLLWHVSPVQLLTFCGIVVAGIAAVRSLSLPGRAVLSTVLGGFLLVWVTGAILPLVTDSPLLLNLHLLRSSAIIQIITTIALATLIIHMFQAEDRQDRLLWGPALLLTFTLTLSLIWFAAVLLFVRERKAGPVSRVNSAFPRFAIGVTVCAVAINLVVATVSSRAYARDRQRWLDLAEWTRRSTAVEEIVLLPVIGTRLEGPLRIEEAMLERSKLLVGSEPFWALAHRRIWISGKQGGAVMWQPHYHDEWRSRLVDALALKTLPERLAYARRHGIGLVVDSCEDAGRVAPDYRSGPLCAFHVDGSGG